MGGLHMDPVLEQETDAAEVQTAHSGRATAEMSRGHGIGLSAGGIDASAEMGDRQENSPFASGKDTFFARSALQQNDAADAGEVKHSVPQGSEQGGFLEWIQGVFGGGRAENRNAAMQERLVNEEQQRYQGAEPEPEQSKWVEDDYGKVDEKNVTYEPNGGILEGMLNDTDIEGPAQSPVFETHSFAPRKAVDDVDWMRLHSFIGLRFTRWDPTYGVRRKHIKVGFGSREGTPFGPGGLRNDWGNQADASTETPITKEKLEHLFGKIQEKGTQQYNVLTHNCAHFAKEMAQEAGASIPASFQDSLLGPAGANKKIAAAATEGEQEDGTRIFQGGSVGNDGEMGMKYRHKLIAGFYQTAKSAARWDATPFLLYRELEGNARSMAEATAKMDQFLVRNAKWIDKREDLEAAETAIREVNERGRRLISTRTMLSHPRVNMVAMKALALAREIERVYFPKRHLLDNGADEFTRFGALEARTADEYASVGALDEKHREIQRQGLSDEERRERIRNIPRIGSSNRAYFGGLTEGNNGRIRDANDKENFAIVQRNRKMMGEMFLEAAGLTPEILLHESMGIGEELTGTLGEQARVEHIMERIAQGLEAHGGDRHIEEYLQYYVRQHAHLSRSQIAATITASMLEQMEAVSLTIKNGSFIELGALRRLHNGVAARREEGSLDNIGGGGDGVEDFVQKQTRTTTRRVPNYDRRLQALEKTNQIERFFARRMDEMMGAEVPIGELVPERFPEEEEAVQQPAAEQAQAVEVLAAAPAPEQVLNAPEAPAQADEAAVELTQQKKKQAEGQ